MIRLIKSSVIFGVGVGAGFVGGYVKAGYDLDQEAIRDLHKIGKEFFSDATWALHQNVQQRRKQTEYFAQAASATERVAEKRDAQQRLQETAERLKAEGKTTIRVRQLKTGETVDMDIDEFFKEYEPVDDDNHEEEIPHGG